MKKETSGPARDRTRYIRTIKVAVKRFKPYACRHGQRSLMNFDRSNLTLIKFIKKVKGNEYNRGESAILDDVTAADFIESGFAVELTSEIDWLRYYIGCPSMKLMGRC